MNKISISLAALVLLMSGCSEKPEESTKAAETVKEQTAPAVAVESAPVQNIYGTSAQPQQQAAAPEGADVQTNSAHVANVLETMDAAGYTYVKVDEDGNVYWIAGPRSAVVVGSSISYIEQMIMKDFTSKSLNKTFDILMFTTTIIPAGEAAAATAGTQKAHDCEDCGNGAKKAPAVQQQAAASTHSSTQATPKTQEQAAPINVAKAEGGYSVEELYAKKAELKDQKITIKAKVVKVSKNIMGKDWVHLQDGTGVAGSTNDIIATGLNTTVNVGDVVTAKATLNTDVDLGYGYFFAVILQESTFTN
ncbi:MAG: hypothetical protein ABFR02_05070 [Campylobacterota bacterium]